MGKTKSHDEYVSELLDKKIDVEVLEIYVSAKTPILHRCKKHDVIWKSRPNDILRGKGCEKCKLEKIASKKNKGHDSYVNELAISNPNLEVIEKYIRIDVPILHRCKKHNITWKCIPHNALSGVGCYQCGLEKYRDKCAKTQEEYIFELSEKNPNLEVIGEYVNINTKILHRCKTHNLTWEISPINALHGQGCKKCKGQKIHDSLSNTHEKYLEELKNKNPNIIPLEEYQNCHTPILHLCKKHNVSWKTAPECVLVGGGCYLCRSEKISNSLSLSQDEYLDRLNEIGSCIKPIEKYKNINTPIKHLCMIHHLEYDVSPMSVLQGHGCPKCGSEKLHDYAIKSHEEYLEELEEKGIDVEVLEEYSGANVPIAHLCKMHNTIWWPTPSNVLRGNSLGCPQCRAYKGENLIEKWLNKNNINYIFQYRFNDCKAHRALPFDFYLPDYNKCIEYDGVQHFKPVDYFGGQESFETLRYHDQIKDTYCQIRHIPLLRISYGEDIEAKLNDFLFN